MRGGGGTALPAEAQRCLPPLPAACLGLPGQSLAPGTHPGWWSLLWRACVQATTANVFTKNDH